MGTPEFAVPILKTQCLMKIFFVFAVPTVKTQRLLKIFFCACRSDCENTVVSDFCSTPDLLRKKHVEFDQCLAFLMFYHGNR